MPLQANVLLCIRMRTRGICALAYSHLFMFFCLLLSLPGNQQRALDQRAGVKVDIMKKNWQPGEEQYEKKKFYLGPKDRRKVLTEVKM